MRTFLLAVAVLALAAGVAGIAIVGGDGGGDGGPTLTSEAWQRRANTACRRTARKLAMLPRLERDVTGYTAAALPLWRELATGLGALRPPVELEDEAAAYVEQLDYLGTRLLDLYTAAQRQDDERRAAAIGTSRDAAVNAARRARELGLVSCAALGIP